MQSFLKRESNLAKRMTPSQSITISFVALICCGAFLLNLPAASVTGESIGLLSALFTATSAVCVTGLTVVNTTAHWTVFGKVVIILLIQFGALGLLSFVTLGMLALKGRISLKNLLVIQASYNQDSIGGINSFLKKVFVYTVSLEIIGALLLAIGFYFTQNMPIAQALSNGFFHAVSAFCNAGFDLLGSESLTPYHNNLPFQLIIMALIILGGLGFTVLDELKDLYLNKNKKPLFRRITALSLHSKIAVTGTIILLISGTAIFMALEYSNSTTLGTLSLSDKISASLFQSVTLRTAGFNTISQSGLTEASKFVSCLFMLVGGSPAGTAGGIKTVTLGVILAAMLSVLRGRNKIEAFGRTISIDLLQKALTVVCTMLIVVFTAALILNFTERGNSFEHSFLDLLFECSSAVGTVGITTGITPHLSTAGRIVIILCMFIGRLSPVTIVVALNMKLQSSDNLIQYIDENIIVG